MVRRPAWLPLARQDGRRFVVTGATSGLGLAAASMLSHGGASVVLAVRDEKRGRAAAASMPGSTEVRHLDVSDLSSVRAFVSDMGEVDVLINNAGVMAIPEARTADGFELQMATNYLGHFALTPGNTYFGPDGPWELRGRPVSVGRSAAAGDPDLAKLLWTESARLTGSDWPA